MTQPSDRAIGMICILIGFDSDTFARFTDDAVTILREFD